MVSANTESDMPKVAFGSVVATTFMYGTPMRLASQGIQSTGTRSIVFIRKIHTNRVSAMGATRSFLPVNVPRTLSSTNSMMVSTKFWKPPGTSAVAVRATLRNSHRKSAPRPTDHSIVSTWMAQKPIALASAALCAKPRPCSGCTPSTRFCKWCWMYSVEVCAAMFRVSEGAGRVRSGAGRFRADAVQFR